MIECVIEICVMNLGFCMWEQQSSMVFSPKRLALA